MAVNLRLADLMEGARNFIKMFNIKRGENVVFVAQDESDRESLEVAAAAIQEVGAEFTLIYIRPPKLAHNDPPPPVVQALYHSDVFASVYPLFIGHCPAALRARWDYGARQTDLLAMPGLFASEWARYPVELFNATARKVLQQMEGGKYLRVTDPLGTNIKANYDLNLLAGAVTACRDGYVTPGMRCTFPLGTFGIYPGGGEGGSSDGVAVFQYWWYFPGKLSQPVKLTVKNRRVVAIEGGKEAEAIKALMDSHPNGRHHAEIMFGLNPKAAVGRYMEEGTHLFPERHAGILHMGWGNSLVLSGPVWASVHTDGMIMKPTLTVDDKRVIIDNGRLTALDAPELRELAKKYGDPAQVLAEVA